MADSWYGDVVSATKGHLAGECKPIIDLIDLLYPAIIADAERLGYGLALCHNDTYEPDYLYGNQGDMYFIDWEHDGINYAANDSGCILCCFDRTDVQIARFLRY